MIQTKLPANLHIPLIPLFILWQLKKSGYQAHIVGGAVRDTLVAGLNDNNQQQKFDFDFTTNAKPEEIQKVFPESFYENDFGTVAVTYQEMVQQICRQLDIQPSNQLFQQLNNDHSPNINNDLVIDLDQATKIHSSLTPSPEKNPVIDKQQPNYEITTYRSKELYDDFRRPSSLQWGQTIEEDLARRDFTINAIALDIDQKKLDQIFTNLKSLDDKSLTFTNDSCQLVDLYQGLDDLNSGVIKTVGNPNKRFSEDALRMLRAIRFSVQLNMQIDELSYQAIIKNAHLIKEISWERIRDEFIKILKSNFAAEGIQIMDDAGMLEFILPELIQGKGVQQGGHHDSDVWTHSIDALRTCPSPDPIVRLATLLHDIGKPETYKIINGNITFYNHEVIGAKIAKKITRRLRLSKNQIDKIWILVRYHMFYYQPHNTDASIRRFMRKVGLENINDILDLREGDRLGSGARRTSWRLEEMKQRMVSQLHQPMDVTDLAINGHDLTEMGLKPGPIFSQILSQLLEQVLENPELNTKEKLLIEAKKISSK